MGVKVRLTEPRLRRVAGVDLHPGLQEVTDKEWQRMSRHPIGAKLIERGILVERKPKAKASETANRAADLVEEIRETYDVHRLRELKQDSRKTVSEAATEQLAKIEG